MRILVTGGNGFVGRRLVRALVARHDVHVLDSLRFGRLRFADHERRSFSLHEADIRDRESVAKITAEFQPEVIIHLAAIHFIPECNEDPKLAVDTNVHGTVNLLCAAPRGCRFVLASSAAVYRPSVEALKEDDSALGPVDIYGLTKAHAEEYVRILAAGRGLGAVLVRLFNVVGPGETNPHVLPEIVAQLKAGRTTLRLGNVSARRDFIHVADAAAGFAAAATVGEVAHGESLTVNLGTATAHSIADMLEQLREITGKEISAEADPARLRSVDNPILLCDNSKIRRLFGCRPTYDFAQALRDTWEEPDLPEYLTQRYAE